MMMQVDPKTAPRNNPKRVRKTTKNASRLKTLGLSRWFLPVLQYIVYTETPDWKIGLEEIFTFVVPLGFSPNKPQVRNA